MRAGRLRHRITIEQATKTNTHGSVTTTWSEFAECWAAVEPLSGREYQRASETQAERTHTVTLRYLAGVTSGMRVRHGGRTLNIETVINKDERNIQLELLCKENA